LVKIGNHRRYSQIEVEKLLGKEVEEKKTIIYSRVSSHEQKNDLKRQTKELKDYCKKKKLENIETIEDVGSGINYKKRGLKKLINWIIGDKVGKIVVSFQDRLLHFGNKLIEQICKLKNIELITIHCLSEM